VPWPRLPNEEPHLPSRDALKAREAAKHPDRPGEECHAQPGAWMPVVNRSKCEGKSECVAVCPYDVFEVGTLPEAEYLAMSFFTRLKMRAHGKKTVFMPRIDACQACGLCVVSCPESALTLKRKGT
jgi:4Fe-4S ferredoxin